MKEQTLCYHKKNHLPNVIRFLQNDKILRLHFCKGLLIQSIDQNINRVFGSVDASVFYKLCKSTTQWIIAEIWFALKTCYWQETAGKELIKKRFKMFNPCGLFKFTTLSGCPCTRTATKLNGCKNSSNYFFNIFLNLLINLSTDQNYQMFTKFP